MMDAREEKLRRFATDPFMREVVFTEIMESFIKQSDSKDIHFLAASRIAIDLLKEAWKELDHYKSVDKPPPKAGLNAGL